MMRVVLLTGASAGIGRAVAIELANERASVALVARRRPLLESLANEVRALGGTPLVLAMDVGKAENIRAMVDTTVQTFGRIDVLINNAAFGYFGSVEKMHPDIIDEILAVNLRAPILAIQEALPIMRRQGGGHIINISSIVGKRGLPMSGIYSATKFALNGISESLRVELQQSGIHVSIVYPVGTATEFSEAMRHGEFKEKPRPLGRVQSAETVAHAVMRCIRNPKLEVYPFGPARLLAWASTVAPSLVDLAMGRALRARIGDMK